MTCSGTGTVLERWTAAFREGADLLGADTPAGARMAESVDYFEFVSAELPAILAKWQEHKSSRVADPRPNVGNTGTK